MFKGLSKRLGSKKESSSCHSCHGKRDRNICFATPEEATQQPPEDYIFVNCINTRQVKDNEKKPPDALMTVDVNPKSKKYGQVVFTLKMQGPDDELHHSGWNACAGCIHDQSACRTHLLLPTLRSNKIYVIETADPKNLTIHKTISQAELAKLDVTFPHTTHCLPTGDVLISTLGDKNGNPKCDMILLDSKTFEVKRSWPKPPSNNISPPQFGYDFWYQPKFNVLLSSEWGSPNAIIKGFNPEDIKKGKYGKSVHMWNFETGELLQNIPFDDATGFLPLEVRFKHAVNDSNAFIGTALGSAIYHVYKEEGDDTWKSRCAYSFEPLVFQKKTIPALVTDILISMDDRFLYVSLWFHGEIRKFDISDSFNIHPVGTVSISGLIGTPLVVKGVVIQGGPQMLQLSLDGKRLYVTNSLFSIWDKQFYPNLPKNGGQMLKINTDDMSVDPNFVVDFGDPLHFPDGPYCPHEMRYPGGDCTSDIFVPPK